MRTSLVMAGLLGLAVGASVLVALPDSGALRPASTPLPPWHHAPGVEPRRQPETSGVRAPLPWEGTAKASSPEPVRRSSLRVVWQDEVLVELDADDLADHVGCVTVPRGRHASARALSLAGFVLDRKDVHGVEVWSGGGTALALSAASLRKDPARHLVVVSGRRTFKLLDMKRDTSRAAMRDVAAIRLR